MLHHYSPRQAVTHLLAIIVLTVAVYGTTLHNQFSVDDFDFVVNNKAVHGFSLQNLQSIFTSVPNGVEYLPVKDLTYCLDYEIWGGNPFGYHLSNLVYYLLCCIGVFFLADALFAWWDTGSRPAVLLVTALFALHPQHVASVASISQRKDLVSGILFLATCLCYLRYRTTARKEMYVASVVVFTLALLSKATVIAMPFAFLLLELLAPQRKRIPLRKALLLLVPYFTAVVVFALINNEILKKTGVIVPFYSAALSGYEVRIYTALRAIFYYIKLLVVPYPLLMNHQFEFSKAFAEPAVILSLCGVLGLVACIWLIRRRAPLIAFGLSWCLISFLPVIGLIPSNTLIAERYLFLPVAGFALAVGAALHMAAGRGRQVAAAATAISCALLVTYSGIVYRRGPEWKDNLSLVLSNIRDVPGSPILYYQAGSEYFTRGDRDRTLAYMKKASEMNSFYAIHYAVYAAIMAYEKNRPMDALDILDRTQNSFKLYVLEVNYLYGKIYQVLGDREKAALFYRNAKNSKMPLGVFSQADVEVAMNSLKQ